MEELNVKLGADGSQLSPELRKAQEEFKNYGKKVESVLSESDKAYIRSRNASRSFTTSIRESIGSASRGLGVDISGVTDNLENLEGGLRKISASSKATGQSISKTLVSSLVGGAGLASGVTLVTSALTLLARNPEVLAGAIDYLSGVVRSATGTLRAFNDELTETTAKAKVEIASLENLISIAKDEKLSRDARTEAVKKLKQEYPEQLKFLSLENIESKKTAAAIDLLSNSLLRKAKIQAAEKILGEAFVKQLKAQNQSITEQSSTVAKVVGAISTAAGFKNIVALTNGFENQQKTLKETAKDITTYTELIRKLNSEEATGGTLYDDKPEKIRKVKDEVEKLKKTTQEWLDLMFAKGRDKAVAGLPTDSGLTNTNNAQAVISAQQQAIQMKAALARNKELVSQSILELNTFITGVSESLGRSFGDFFANIVTQGKLSFKSLGDSLLNIFNQILSNAITIRLTKIFKNLLTGIATGGTSGILGGIAKFLIPGFANGVENFSGGLAYVHAGEVLTNLAPGTNVIPANQVGKGGGGMAQVFIATSYQRADMIVTSYERGERTLGRVI